MLRKFHIQDEGDYLEVFMIQDGDRIAGALVDVEPIGVDAAFDLATRLGVSFVNPVGDGAAPAPYRPN